MSLRFSNLKNNLVREPNFRLQQAIKAIYHDYVDDWQMISVLPKALRAKLSQNCPLDIIAEHIVSGNEQTWKAQVKFGEDIIETVLMRHQGRNTVCVSTQVGCALNCRFCLTGAMGFVRNLTMDEMLNQVLYFSRLLKSKGERVNSIVFMGMGEPFNNYNNVLLAIAKFNDPNLFAIGARHISISTSGVVPGIKRLSKEKLQINLSISLHAPTDTVRSEIMPVNEIYPLGVLLPAVRAYIQKTNRRVMIEYLMLKGINDSPIQANLLSKLLKSALGDLYFVNIIEYNPTGRFESSNRRTINIFKRILTKEGIAVVERYRFGQDIQGACGQLSSQNN